MPLPFSDLSAVPEGLSGLEAAMTLRVVVMLVGDTGGCPLMDTGGS